MKRNSENRAVFPILFVAFFLCAHVYVCFSAFALVLAHFYVLFCSVRFDLYNTWQWIDANMSYTTHCYLFVQIHMLFRAA